MTQKPVYVVVNENTLGYLAESGVDGYQTLGVLAGSVVRGGKNPLNGPAVVTPLDRVRLATKKDFADYRIDSTGHLP